MANETDGTDIPAMEAIAGKAPLSAVCRPGWDIDVLEGLGMSVKPGSGHLEEGCGRGGAHQQRFHAHVYDSGGKGMRRYVIRRLLLLIPDSAGGNLSVFALMQVAGSDAVMQRAEVSRDSPLPEVMDAQGSARIGQALSGTVCLPGWAIFCGEISG